MMRLPAFRYVAPRTAREAARILADNGADAMPVAGGTDLYPNMKRKQFEPKLLVGLRGVLEAYGTHANGGLTLGAMTTLADVAANPAILERWPAVARAARLVSSPPLRNAGTIGGNLCVDTRCNYYNQSEFWRASIGYCMKKDGDICLVAPGSSVCWALSSSDTAPVMLALGAEVTLVAHDAERRIPVGELYGRDGIDYLAKKPHEILTAIHVPASRTSRPSPSTTPISRMPGASGWCGSRSHARSGSWPGCRPETCLPFSSATRDLRLALERDTDSALDSARGKGGDGKPEEWRRLDADVGLWIEPVQHV
jgi:4-hydroxybenzoyl-CoA reductase beta subunit